MGKFGNMVLRVGFDGSKVTTGLKKMGNSAASAGRRVKEALDFRSVSSKVDNILGAGKITDITADNIEKAKQQLEILRKYREQMQSIGFTDDTHDEKYGLASERFQELTYDVDEYTYALTHKKAAEEASAEATEEQISPLRRLGRWLKSIPSHIPGIRRLSERLRGVGTSASSSGKSLTQMVGSLRRIALVSGAFRIAGAALGRLRSIVSGYISENATLQAQVNGLKTGLGQALAPAINLVINGLSLLMPYVLGVGNAIGSLMSSLFGSGWTAAANGAKKTAAATSGAAKAQQDLNRQLLSFDEINKISENQSSAASGSGGGAGEASIPVESKTPAWLERFKTTFSDLFNSDEFKAANIGGKLGMSLQAGLDWLGGEGARFDWSGAGQKLRESFDSFFSAGWWESLWKDVGIFAAGIGDFILGFFQPEWDELKKAYQEGGVKGAAGFLAGLALGIVHGIADAVLGAIQGIGSGLAEYFEKHGNASAAGYWKGFTDKVQNIREKLDEAFDKVITWVKEKLGIHSPSTVFAGFGENSAAGFVNGFTSKITTFFAKLEELKSKVTSAVNKIKSAFDFNWRLPRLKLPHLKVEWDPVSNTLANFFGVNAFPRLSVSWFARGGILSGAQIFGALGGNLLGGGEAGKEAVLPLERNTGWMDMVAQKVVNLLGGQTGGDYNLTIPVTLDGDVITRIVIRGLREYARSNGGFLV